MSTLMGCLTELQGYLEVKRKTEVKTKDEGKVEKEIAKNVDIVMVW